MTKRDTNILSEKELFVKTSRIVEHVIDGEVKIIYGKAPNFCLYEGLKQNKLDLKIYPSFTVNLATPAVPNIGQYTALLHELSHILYKSPFSEISDMLSGKKFNLSKFFGNGYNRMVVHSIWNVLEDQRIESHLTKYYIDYRKRFEKTLVSLGKGIGDGEGHGEDNPLFVLLAIRFFREDLVKDQKIFKQCKKALEDVQGTDPYGALRVLISLAPLIKVYLTKNQIRVSDESSLHSMGKTFKEYCKEKKRVSRHDIYDMNEIPKDLENILQSTEKDISVSNITIDELISEGEKKGKQLSSEIRQKMLGDGDGVIDRTPSSVTMIDRFCGNDVKIEADLKTVNGLKRVFEKIKMNQKPIIDFEGEELDVEEYVKRKIIGTQINKCKINGKKQTGASIIVSIDASTSMNGYKIRTSRNLVATMFKSVDSLKNVKIRGNVWSANTQGTIAMTEINGMNDISKIAIDTKYHITPTHMAFEYSEKQMKEMNGSKKITFIITDGVPNYYVNGSRLQRKHYSNICKKRLRRLLKVCPNVCCILVGYPAPWERQDVYKTFGKKRVIVVDNIDQVSEKVIKQFKGVVVDSI